MAPQTPDRPVAIPLVLFAVINNLTLKKKKKFFSPLFLKTFHFRPRGALSASRPCPARSSSSRLSASRGSRGSYRDWGAAAAPAAAGAPLPAGGDATGPGWAGRTWGEGRRRDRSAGRPGCRQAVPVGSVRDIPGCGVGGGAEPALGAGAGARILRASRCSAASGSGDNGTRCPLGEDDEVRPRWVWLWWRYGRQSCERSTESFFLLANALS